MALSEYHQKYAALPDEEIAKRAEAKATELSLIFAQARPAISGPVAKIAVTGCGDRRFIAHHAEIFSRHLGKPAEIFTFDIATEHLAGERNVFRHDCTLPLPEGPFDITYGHVVLRFIETEKQWDMIRNSYDALKPGGLAIHVMDAEDYETKGATLGNGLFSVPLGRWKARLSELGAEFREVPVKYGLALAIVKR